jgi:hypothetical protein
LAIEAVRKYPDRFAIMGWFYLDDANGRDLAMRRARSPGDGPIKRMGKMGGFRP